MLCQTEQLKMVENWTPGLSRLYKGFLVIFTSAGPRFEQFLSLFSAGARTEFQVYQFWFLYMNARR